jgi:NADH-quinone oxidoreductase subunit L
MSQLGLMFLALGLVLSSCIHVITLSFKACLFLGSGSVIHALHGEQDMRKMGGLKSNDYYLCN